MAEITAGILAGHARLLDGLLTREQLSAETGWGSRTIIRREHEGLPVIVIGGTKLYPIDRVRDWILGHERSHKPPRRGRPPGSEASLGINPGKAPRTVK